MWVLVAIGGCLAFTRLRYALLPDVTFPVIVVDVAAPYPSATQVEAQLTSRIERALAGMAGLDDIRSSSFPGHAVVSAAFLVGEDIAAAHRRVEARLRGLTLPAGINVTTSEVNLNETSVVTYVLLDTTRTPNDLAAFARRLIVPSLAHVPGVLEARLLGVGSTAVRLNHTGGVAIQIIKQAGANTLDVSGRVTATVARLAPRLDGAQLIPVANQAEYIAEASRATLDALAIAILLSVLVIFPFLNDWHATAISALAIPTSLLGTGIVMAWAGFNLETITLLALAIVIGIIVDDAIVDVENIARHIELGQEPTDAAALATDEIGLTVSAATLTIVAVFLPVGLMGGVVGRFFRPFGLTISAAVITSLLVARTLSPVLAARWLRRKGQADAASSAPWRRMVAGYERVLNWSLRHRLVVIVIALASFAAGLAIIPFIPRGFIPRLDRGEFLVQYAAPLGAPLAQSVVIARQIEDSIVTQHGVLSVYSIAGSTTGEVNTGTLRVRLDPRAHLASAQMEERLRTRLPQITGVTMSIGDIPFVDVVGQKPFEIAVTGRSLADVRRGAQAFADRLQRESGLVDVSVSGIATIGNVPVEINHLNGIPVASVTANLTAGTSLGAETDRAKAIARAVLPPTVTSSLGADSQTASDLFNSFGRTLMLSVLCIAVVLVLMFRSWVDPAAIILALPLCAVGAMLGLFVTRTDFGIVSLLGLVFLLGLVNKNAVLLVDYIAHLRRHGAGRRDAILTAGPIRLRPILMTTTATVLGMLPIALGIGAGSELRSPMAVAIIGGLITSTLLSLVVVPVLYTLLDDLRTHLHRSRSAVRAA